MEDLIVKYSTDNTITPKLNNEFTSKDQLIVPHPEYYLDSHGVIIQNFNQFITKVYFDKLTLIAHYGKCPIMKDQRIDFNFEDKDCHIFASSIFLLNSHPQVYYLFYSLEKNGNVTRFISFLKSYNTSINSSIYTFNRGAYYKSQSAIKSANMLIGCDHLFSFVKNDISNMNNNYERLLKMGVNMGKNYILKGPPGTGKSTFVKKIALMHGYPLLIAEINDDREINAGLLSPDKVYDRKTNVSKKIRNTIIMLFEDCDQYFKNGNIAMSKLLNCLDGVVSDKKIIRFFTINDSTNMSDNKALMTRISRVLNFELPNEDIFIEYLETFFPGNLLNNQLSEIATEKQISFRQFINYVSRFIQNEDPIKDCIENFTFYCDELSELESIHTLASLEINEQNKNSTQTSDIVSRKLTSSAFSGRGRPY